MGVFLSVPVGRAFHGTSNRRWRNRGRRPRNPRKRKLLRSTPIPVTLADRNTPNFFPHGDYCRRLVALTAGRSGT